MKPYCLFFLSLYFSLSLVAQDDLLQAGPMVGYAEMQEVSLWVQTREAATVAIAYWPEGQVNARIMTEAHSTEKSTAYTAHLLADQVEPGVSYRYELLINGQAVARDYPLEFQTPPLWQYRTDPPDFSVALGSCAYVNDPLYDRPGNPYGGNYEIFQAIHAKDPDLMVWLGDNTYLREADWYSRTGMVHRYTHTRSLAEMQPLLGSASNYAIWDDHDYGPNHSDRSWGRKTLSTELFSLFWANPTVGVDTWGGTTSTFEWGDAQFFLLDNRFFRTPNNKDTEERSILGNEQYTWLVDALVSSSATFKFVCIGGQVLNSVEGFENHAQVAPEERLGLLHTLAKERVKNVIFLTGDRHHSEVSHFEKDGIRFYDLTTSPLTAGPHDASDEGNSLRIPGSHIGQRNFSIMKLSGPRLERKLEITYFDSQGVELWQYAIDATY